MCFPSYLLRVDCLFKWLLHLYWCQVIWVKTCWTNCSHGHLMLLFDKCSTTTNKLFNLIIFHGNIPRPPHLKLLTNTHTLTYHLLYIDSCTDILYYCTQLVQMNCTSVYTTHINGTRTHTDIALYCHSRLHLKISAKADRWTTKVVLFPDCFYFLLLRFLRELQHIHFVLDTLFNFILCIGIWRIGHFTVLKKHSEQDSRPTKYTLKNHLKNNPPT